ncbi:MAG: NAD(P)/FAD-dependent oxidoreductase [Phaeodactylibacter sp.]|uniref:FAD-dependent oxidoreductase n=1 Tax=Phaeodactylibacter sp. TaxID=1940289 RepID=UPI0032EE9FF1
MKDPILIVGAGLVGSLWAVLLAKRGYQVEVFELRDDPRRAGFKGGRSINLAMSDRGWKAMERAGIKDTIRQQAIPMHGRKMHDTTGQLTFQPYGEADQAIYSVSRGGLNIELINIADQYGQVKFHFGYKCLGLEAESPTAHFEHRETVERLSVKASRIFGTDGAFSAVRRSLMKALPRFNYSQSFLDYGYKELHIPPTADGKHALDPNALHIWPRGQFMMIALPNVDGSFTGTLFLAYEGQTPAFEQLHTDEQIMAFFEQYFSDAIPLIPNLLEEFHENPTSSLVTIRCSPWCCEDKVLIMGDASHAIVPFYGQGMNSGFEDCTLLDELLEEHQGNWTTTIEVFNATRIKNANAIADLALRNFVEMRDKVADPKFLLRKEIAAHLNKVHPEFLPLYTQVTFSHIPYSEALAEGEAQDALFEDILALKDIEKNWKGHPEIERIFKQWMANRQARATA